MPSAPPTMPEQTAEESEKDTGGMTAVELTAHVLAGAGDRVRAAVERLTRMGVIDDEGAVVAKELPRDMRPESQTTVVTG